MRNIKFANDCYYHVYNRGVDKRQIFMDDGDYYRLLHDLWEFNDTAYVPPFVRRTSGISNPHLTVGDRVSYSRNRTPGHQKSRQTLVDIICFCLMPNHFHLLLKQKRDSGISLFMEKLGKGYARYFNEKYDRSGALFQGKFKAKHIDNDAYFLQLSKYIHLNPADLYQPDWEKTGLGSPEMAKNFLMNYKWSSLKDYIGEKNYPSLINNGLIINMMGNESSYKKFVFDNLNGNVDHLKNYLLD